MPYLGSFRKGWENENLASFILSRFSFIANPVSVSDDLGNDFFCTLFETKKIEKHEYLIPKNAFLIQIKSNSRDIDITEKAEYYNSLELPVFIGIVDRKNLSLKIYSAEYLPIFFPWKGNPKQLIIKPCSKLPKKGFLTNHGAKKYTINAPQLIKIKANSTDSEIQYVVEILKVTCIRIQRNIASKNMGEHLYLLPDSILFVFAGPGSETVFRRNFYNRLIELFCNLDRILRLKPTQQIFKETQFYLDFYQRLISISPEGLPSFLQNRYQSLKQRYDKKTATTPYSAYTP